MDLFLFSFLPFKILASRSYYSDFIALAVVSFLITISTEQKLWAKYVGAEGDGDQIRGEAILEKKMVRRGPKKEKRHKKLEKT